MQAEFSGVESKRLPGDIGFLRAVKDFVCISHTIFFRNIGEDWNSDLDYVSSKTTPFWPEPKVHDEHVIRTQETSEVKINEMFRQGKIHKI